MTLPSTTPAYAGARRAAPAQASDARASRRRGLLLVAGAAAVWSTGGLLVRLVDTDPATTVFWRFFFCALFLLAVIAVQERGRTVAVFRQMGWPGLVVAACFAIASTGLVLSLTFTTVANTLVIYSTSPFWAALFGWIALRERVRPVSWGAMIVALAGIALMVSDSLGKGTLKGDAISFVGPIVFAIAVVTLRRHPGIRMRPAACVAAVFGLLAALPWAAPGAASGSDMVYLFLLGVAQLGLGLVLFVTGARYLPAAETALIGMLETILGPLWVWIALGENPGAYALLGGAVVLGALVTYTLLDARPSRALPAQV